MTKFKPGDYVQHKNIHEYGVGEVQGPYPSFMGGDPFYVVYFEFAPNHKMFTFGEDVLVLDALHTLAKL